MTAQLVTVILDRFDGAERAYVKGTATWTPSLEFPDTADQMLIGMAPVTATFRASGLPQVIVIANDTAGPQQENGTPGWTWNVTYSGVPGNPAPASYYVLSTNGGTQYLSALAQVPAAQPGQQYVPLPAVPPSSASQVLGLASDSPMVTGWVDQSGGGGGSGTVTSVSVATANGFAGTVASPTATPAITLKTTTNGLLKGNSTTGVVSAATAGTDYLAPNGSGAALTGITAAQVGADASGAAAAAQSNAETYAAAQASAAQSAAEAASDPAGSAATAQTNAQTFATNAVATETTRAETAEALLAPKASPPFTGTPTAPTATALTSTTQLATTAYTDSAVAVETTRAGAAEALKAPLASPALTGSPTAPTQTTGDTSAKIATDAFVGTAVAAEATRATGVEGTLSTAVSTETTRAEAAEALLAPRASPVFTGTPAAPTASPGTNTTQLATTAFATAAASAAQSAAQAASLPVADDLSAIATANATAANVPMNSKKLTGLANGSAATDSAAFGQIPLIDPTAGDIQPVGTAAGAGAKGQVADAAHVHKGFAKLATTGTAGFALQNATPNIISWTAPNDGAMHMFVCISVAHVTSTETGGTVQVVYQSPVSGAANHFTQAFAAGLATDTNGQTGTTVFALVQPGTTVTVQQTSALTAGAATVYAELWGN